MNNIYIGYDTRESICYDVCEYSITKNTRSPVNISPIKLSEVSNIHDRNHDPLASTEFTYTRFLTPYLSKYNGLVLFCDCDFLFLDDVQHIFDMYDDKYAVMVCKHNYVPKNSVKMDGQIQSTYPMKNWSSLILWNCAHPKNRKLLPSHVNTKSGKFLHRFEWLESTDIGAIPVEWNWLTDWYTSPADGAPKALHYTAGGPWFPGLQDCNYADTWNDYKCMMTNKS